MHLVSVQLNLPIASIEVINSLHLFCIVRFSLFFVAHISLSIRVKLFGS